MQLLTLLCNIVSLSPLLIVRQHALPWCQGQVTSNAFFTKKKSSISFKRARVRYAMPERDRKDQGENSQSKRVRTGSLLIVG